MQKILLDFGDLDPIFKVTRGQKRLEKSLACTIYLKEWMDFNQTYTDKTFLVFFWQASKTSLSV